MNKIEENKKKAFLKESFTLYVHHGFLFLSRTLSCETTFGK